MTAGYYHSPTIHGEPIGFVSEDDLWTVPISRGLARRLTSNLGEITSPRLSPDGTLLAFAGCEEGYLEVYVMPTEGGSVRRLTYLGGDCQIVGWNPQRTTIIFASTSGHWDDYLLFQIAADSLNGTAKALPYGPTRSIAFGPDEQSLSDAAWEIPLDGSVIEEGRLDTYGLDVWASLNLSYPMCAVILQPPCGFGRVSLHQMTKEQLLMYQLNAHP